MLLEKVALWGHKMLVGWRKQVAQADTIQQKFILDFVDIALNSEGFSLAPFFVFVIRQSADLYQGLMLDFSLE